MRLGGRLLSMLSGFCRIIFARIFIRRGGVANNSVLISICGNLGDFLLGANAYIALIKHYTAQGKRVCFCGPRQSRAFLQRFPGFDEVSIIECGGSLESAGAAKEAFRSFGTVEFEKIIIFGAGISWESMLLISSLRHNESWMVTHKRRLCSASELLKQLLSGCYTNRIVVPLDMQQQQRDKLLLEKLGVRDYCTRIYPIPKAGDCPAAQPYVTVAVDSSSSYRRWDADNFIELVRGLREAYGCGVYITGSNVSDGDMRRYEQAFQDDRFVKITVGQLDLGQWIELIRGSRLHIGLDSGSIHVAASVGTKCFCLCGVWAGHRVMPYRTDRRTPGTLEPICIYRQDTDPEKLPCYGCVELGKLGDGNAQCRAACRAGKPCQCLERITAGQVLRTVREEAPALPGPPV